MAPSRRLVTLSVVSFVIHVAVHFVSPQGLFEQLFSLERCAQKQLQAAGDSALVLHPHCAGDTGAFTLLGSVASV